MPSIEFRMGLTADSLGPRSYTSIFGMYLLSSKSRRGQGQHDIPKEKIFCNYSIILY